MDPCRVLGLLPPASRGRSSSWDSRRASHTSPPKGVDRRDPSGGGVFTTLHASRCCQLWLVRGGETPLFARAVFGMQWFDAFASTHVKVVGITWMFDLLLELLVLGIVLGLAVCSCRQNFRFLGTNFKCSSRLCLLVSTATDEF